jgi:hypothetical protein
MVAAQPHTPLKAWNLRAFRFRDRRFRKPPSKGVLHVGDLGSLAAEKDAYDVEA